MPLGKQGKDIVATIETAGKRCADFAGKAATLDAATFKDTALRLALELIKYGEYIKITLLMDSTKRSAQPEKRVLSEQDKLAHMGASEEEKAAIENTPPPGFLT